MHYIKEKCPTCKIKLCTDGTHVWCRHCTYGNKEAKDAWLKEVKEHRRSGESLLKLAPRVMRETLRYGRWYVTLDALYEEFGRKEIPKANYVWLVNNPSFKSLPFGYVVHHLDHNPLNDDLSNLALMQKHHHLAHHYKDIIINPELHIDYHCLEATKGIYFPTRLPGIYQRKDVKSSFFLAFYEKKNGKTQRVVVSKWNGMKLATREEAETVRDEIWSNYKARLAKEFEVID